MSDPITNVGILSAQKIGESNDSNNTTVFGKLNNLDSGSDVILDAVGEKGDFVNVPYQPGTESIMAYNTTGYYHIHGASFLYPDKANPVTLTSSAAAWSQTGTITEIIPANTITKDFDLHWASISDISANLYGVIDFFSGAVGQEVKICSVDVVRTTAQSRENAMPMQIPQQPANTRISARFSDSTTSSRTVAVKLYGHVYGNSL